ncbi:MAG: DEAD/DEAH box helicase family protein [Halobacteriota archaeon]
MVNPKSLGTRHIPLKFAKIVTQMANKEWEDGSFLDKVTPITRDLLRFWFQDAFCETRRFNFHEGQKQAILNTIYMHEVLKTKNVMDMYMSAHPELLQEMDLLNLKQDKYSHPKYAIKMATGTGKTWVLNALLIWQYLNVKHEEQPSGMFAKNFLLVAPGLIVYERLLDAYLGKEQENRQRLKREFEESDFKKFEELFVPPAYKDEIFGFIQSNVARKEEIGKKVTGEGLIAITNWHLLAGEEELIEAASPLEDPSQVVKDIMPITPGITAGHALDTLDNQYLKGKEMEYLANLPDLVVFNDEAHHIHEFKKAGEVFEVEWQKSLLKIAEQKNGKFIQIDFSATPYIVTGSGQKRTKHYAPHIIVDFDLRTAIKNGFVKTIALDRRKEIASLPLDFKAERNGESVVLSEGQKIMLRAGLKKLKILEKEFVELTADKDQVSNKRPKMFVICEDTKVAPSVVGFLTKFEGLSEDEVMEIHSNKKGDVSQKEWERIKQRLFNIDKREKPKVIVSVLMLREGFDVNNICVIVPLRPLSSNMLLEQTIGRGLRLMWREPEFKEIKDENRVKLLERKEEPSNYLDILSIVEHPAFIQFYDDLIKDGAMGTITEDISTRGSILGDIIKVGLRENYQEYDFYFPIIIQDKEENLVPIDLSLDNLEPFPVPLETLNKLVPIGGDVFKSKEITVGTEFGEYSVTADIFTAKSYNEIIAKFVRGVSSLLVPAEKKTKKSFPMMQINNAEIARLTDNYIRNKLFNQEFNPLEDNNWRVLFLSESKLIEHLIKNVSKAIYDLQTNVDVTEAKVMKSYFSEVSELKMRENFSLDVAKAIYEKLPYPSHKGGFEKSFIEFVDKDSKVKAFIKINENYHDFAHITYIREDGLLSHYYPDFVVRIDDKIYIVETKAQKDVNNPNVKQKRLATIDWINKINELKPEDRMNCTWDYVLLGENTFYEFQDKGASTEEILEYAKMTKAKIEGTVGEFISF